ncbi:MAG: hypothetical protein JWN04_2837 [Myxococcaceae bacterium]|nr:hypothetical protein [Myxococcaceae bacterium]
MPNNTFRSAVLLATLAAAGATGGCAKHNQPPTTAERAKHAHGEITDNEKLTATVDSIDKANQTIILHDDQGRKFAMDADQSALQRLKPNDQIKVVYQEALAFALEDPAKQKGPDETKVEESAEQTKGNGVQVGRKITTTVQILSVAPRGTSVEFRLPEGPVRTIAIDDEKNQKEIENLRPGDSVRVTFTEKLALAVDESNAT